MTERSWANGNQAVGWGAVSAGCMHFFGYPITPQNEITEWFAEELPKRGGVFVQAESEWSGAAMLFGASSTGVRTMTSTSSPGWGLMQEVLSCIAAAELPCVIVNVQRGGPGQGTTQHAQTDYLSATRGGHGGYKNFVLAPASVQENCNLVQLAFYLADKYRALSVVLTDAIIGQMAEPLEIETLDFGPLPAKDWALIGSGQKNGNCSMIKTSLGLLGTPYCSSMAHLKEKYDQMSTEVRFETLQTDDAELILVAFGYPARVCLDVVESARAEGIRVGLIRPITLWPFPYEAMKEKAQDGAKFLVVEDNLGQMIDDVRLGVEGKAPVHHLGILARHQPTSAGMILPARVLEEVKKLL